MIRRKEGGVGVLVFGMITQSIERACLRFGLELANGLPQVYQSDLIREKLDRLLGRYLGPLLRFEHALLT
jgi:hypothetical protein